MLKVHSKITTRRKNHMKRKKDSPIRSSSKKMTSSCCPPVSTREQTTVVNALDYDEDSRNEKKGRRQAALIMMRAINDSEEAEGESVDSHRPLLPLVSPSSHLPAYLSNLVEHSYEDFFISRCFNPCLVGQLISEGACLCLCER